MIRAEFRKKLPTELRKLQAHVRELDKRLAEAPKASDLERLIRTRMQLVEFLARYGLGTTVTETDTEGRDIVIRVERKPRSLVSDD